ncbi:hypothetical protein, partial [Morganella morganii]|uniref:hypothetical protein n=1 Tax=Morganella morganii TaxID=582 RepID=UPI0033066964
KSTVAEYGLGNEPVVFQCSYCCCSGGATPPYALLPISLHEIQINYWNTARQYALYFDLVMK